MNPAGAPVVIRLCGRTVMLSLAGFPVVPAAVRAVKPVPAVNVSPVGPSTATTPISSASGQVVVSVDEVTAVPEPMSPLPVLVWSSVPALRSPENSNRLAPLASMLAAVVQLLW